MSCHLEIFVQRSNFLSLWGESNQSSRVAATVWKGSSLNQVAVELSEMGLGDMEGRDLERKWTKEPWDFHTLKVEEVGHTIVIYDIIYDHHCPSRTDDRSMPGSSLMDSPKVYTYGPRKSCTFGNKVHLCRTFPFRCHGRLGTERRNFLGNRGGIQHQKV